MSCKYIILMVCGVNKLSLMNTEGGKGGLGDREEVGEDYDGLEGNYCFHSNNN